MIKKGTILIFTILLIVILTVLSFTFFYKNIDNDKLVNRHVNSIRAFWLAEAGVAQACSTLSDASGNIGGSNYTYSAQVSNIPGTADYYRIYSTGTVNPGSTATRKVLEVIVKTGSVDPSKFPYAVETTSDLIIQQAGMDLNSNERETAFPQKRMVDINLDDSETDLLADVGGSVDINPDNSIKEQSTLNFTDLFGGISKVEMRSYADNLYTNSSSFNMDSASHITWVDVAQGVTLDITGGSGSGILIINGNTKISGNATFDGIIYVIGGLTISGGGPPGEENAINGSILVESDPAVATEIKGNVEINYDLTIIATALGEVSSLTREIKSWRECRSDCSGACLPNCQAACLCQN
jgi:Tfp pilus assembly protein PilX